MNAVRKFRRTFRISRYEVTLTVTLVANQPLTMNVEWSKFPPKLSNADRARYRKLRNVVLSEISIQLGERMMIAEADENGIAVYTILHPNGDIETPDLSDVST